MSLFLALLNVILKNFIEITKDDISDYPSPKIGLNQKKIERTNIGPSR